MGKSIWGVPAGPKGWSPPNPGRADRRVLQLREVSILRRMAQGQGRVEIAEALEVDPDSVTRTKRLLRLAFGVDTDKELLEHPDVRSQI